jgi:hypothetical protein
VTRNVRPIIATRAYVWELTRVYDLDPDLAQRIADICLTEVERVGGADARPVFDASDEEAGGLGPICSWCGTLWGLCTHSRLTSRPATGDDQ